MSSEVEELKMKEDVKHTLDLFSLGEMISEEEITEGLSAVLEISRNYRHIPVQLKHELGEDVF